MRTIHRPDGQTAKVIEYSMEPDEDRKLHVFCDFILWILTTLRQQHGEKFWDEATWLEFDWEEIATMLAQEHKQLAEDDEIKIFRGSYYYGIIAEISQAAMKLGYSAQALELMINIYAEHNKLVHLGITKLCDEGEFDKVVMIIVHLYETLKDKPIPQDERKEYEEVLSNYTDKWFVSVNFLPWEVAKERPVYELNERGQKMEDAKLDRMEEEMKQRRERR